MSVKRPTDTDQIESLLLGQVPPAEAEQLSAELADDSRVSEVAERLRDDTLLSAVKDADTSLDTEGEGLVERMVERLKPAAPPSVTMTAIHSTEGPVLIDDDDPVPGMLEYFKIDRVLGHGGMGTVYLADDTRLGRKVAVKTLKAGVARRPGAKERFLREARLAAALEHECLVPIYYVGEAAGIPFLAMPLLKGQPLDEYLVSHGGRLPVPEAIRVAGLIATGLSAAHAAGLIHRDIKPSNVWVEGPGGRVRILDFGLARSAMDDTNLTASGVIIGTPAYMPPEQARGRGVDHRADLFSLGVVMYQMLTGRRPFVGGDTVAILTSLALDTPAAPHTLNPECPPHVSALVMKLLEKDPAQRPQSADAVLAALNPPAVVVVPQAWQIEKTEFDFTPPATPGAKPTPKLAKAQPKPAPVKAPPGRKFPLAATVALGVLLLAGAAAGVYQFAFATKDGTLVVEVADDADVRFKNGKLEVYDEAGKKLYTLEPSEKNKTLPPGKYRVKVVGADGVKLDTETFEIERKGKAFVKVTAAPKDVAVVDPKKTDPVKPDPVKPDPVNPDPVKPVGPGDPVTLPPFTPGTPLALRKPTWKPGPADNILAGLVSRPAILDGVGRWQVVPTTAPAWVVSLSPDGKWVATADADVVRIYDATTGAFKALGKRTNGVQLHGAVLGLDWSHDSKWVRVADFRGLGFDNGDLFAPDGTRSPVPYIQHAGLDFGWNPKFPVFASVVHGTQDQIVVFDPTKKEKVTVVAKQGVKGTAVWSPDGETLLVVREDKTAQLFGRDGEPGVKLAGEVDPAAPPAWSADSKQIAAMASPNEVGFWKKDGTAGKKTGKHEKPILALHWKPDGKLLAVTEAEGKRHFWTTDGTSEGVADTKDATPGFAWAKDGTGFFTPGKFWPAVGNPSFTALAAQLGLGGASAVSPDQTSVWLAKRGEIAVAAWKDGEAKDIGWKIGQSADGQPWWSPDGKWLAVVDANGVTLYDARDPKKVVRLGGGAAVSGLARAAFSPKGDRFAVASNFGSVFVCEPTGKVLRTILTAPAPGNVGGFVPHAVHDIQWHPDGKLLAVTTGAATVTIFDTETGKAEATTVGTNDANSRAGGGAIFSPANPDHLLITHTDAAAVWRWKVEKEPLQKFDGLGKLVLSPDGKRFLSLIPQNRAEVPAALVSLDLKDRDTAGTKDLVALTQHPGPSLAWHPDGKHLVVTRLGEARSIQLRALDGKVVEEVKPDGIDVTWLEWAEPVAKRNVLVGRIGQGPDTYLFDLAAKKLSPFGKVNGELAVSPDGKHLIALDGSSLTYWNLDTKAVEQKVVLLPGGEFVTLSNAGEVLEKSANADNYYRYLVEDKVGKLTVKTPAEMAPSLPK